MTLATLVQSTQNILYGSTPIARPEEDTLNGGITDVATTLTPTTTALWKKNDFAEFQPDGEIVVFAADSAGATAVRRAQRGTTGAAQTDGDTMFKNPPFTIYDIQWTINQVIRNDLWPHVWTWHQDSLTWSAGDYLYDLDQYVQEVTQVYQSNLNSDGRLHPLPNGWWDTEAQINTAVATNSGLLRIARVHDSSATVYYTAKRRPNVSDIANFSSEIVDLIPWAAAAKMMATRGAQVALDAARSRYDDKDKQTNYYRTFMAEFLRMRDALNLTLRDEVREEPRFRPRTRWTY